MLFSPLGERGFGPFDFARVHLVGTEGTHFAYAIVLWKRFQVDGQPKVPRNKILFDAATRAVSQSNVRIDCTVLGCPQVPTCGLLIVHRNPVAEIASVTHLKLCLDVTLFSRLEIPLCGEFVVLFDAKTYTEQTGQREAASIQWQRFAMQLDRLRESLEYEADQEFLDGLVRWLEDWRHEAEVRTRSSFAPRRRI